MKASLTTRAVNGAATGLLQNGLAMLTQLLMTPVILTVAGQQTMGAYAILLQIIGYTLLLDLGFSVALQRFLAQATDLEVTGNQFANLFKVGRLFLLLINIVMALFILVVAGNFNLIFRADPDVLLQAQIALCLQASWIVVRTPLVIYSSALNAAQDMAVLNLIAIPVNILRLLLGLLLIYDDFGLIGLITANITAEVIGGFAQRYFFVRRHKTLFACPTDSSYKRLLAPILRFGVSYWGVNLAAVLLLGSDNLLAGLLFGTATASVFYTTKMIGSLTITVVSRVIDNVLPGAAFLAGKSDLAKLKSAYLRLLRYTLGALIPCALAVVLFTGWLVTAWVGERQYAGDLMALFVAFFVLLQVLAHLHAIMTLAIGNLKHWTAISILCGGLGVCLGYFLGKAYGVAFVTAGIVLGIVPGVVFLIRRVLQGLRLSTREIASCLQPSLVFVGIFVFFYWLKSYLDYSFFNLVTLLSLYTLLSGLTIWYQIISSEERAITQSLLRRKLNCLGFDR